ncbi:T9SS type A sorting domain-containing protein [Chryseobacterium sp. SSA4.19]|uniref:type IX secretion system anionic LPS delivery protein PorZ n=1 Tax=Chryseobacterium sp. SSA4.19 TaxID=2919915 RepID=UPI001F4DA193|nr:T9SS type A sorting domain-containing protein [Chryseobacterium sp. SSA4.19]MCJ8153716.1 T9SS type A sorting domain-containing protein [Chryseobacterium sp. SSA4.19]
MKKLSLISLGILASLPLANAQTISSKKWADLFSYNNVMAMKEDNGKLVAAAENGIFYYTISTGEITKLSKANGLHEVKISAFDYNPQNKTALIGYQNGSMDVVSPDGVKYVVDIPIATGYNGSKKINHISITGDLAVISVGYGVSIFDLKKKEFKDSAFFLSGGVYEASNEATIFGNKVYAVTNTGLKSHEMNTTFPVFGTWTTEMAGSFKHIDSEGVLSFSSGTIGYVYNGGTAVALSQNFSNIRDVVVNTNNIIVTDLNRVYTFNTNGNFNNTVSFGEDCNTATTVGSSVYGGTVLSGIKNESSNSFKPDGPYFNYAYKISLSGENQILVSTGAREARFNTPSNNPKNPGFYYFNGMEWIYPSYFIGNTTRFNVLDAVSDPVNGDDIFFTNYTTESGRGVYKMKYNSGSKDFTFTKNYNLGTNEFSARRAVGLTFDDSNNLFVTIAFSNDNTAFGPFTAIGAYDRATDDFLIRNTNQNYGAAQKALYQDGLLWIPTPRVNNFIAYDANKTVNTSDDKEYILTQANGFASNSGGTISVAIDKSGDAWIGGDVGLRVLQNAVSAVKSPATATVEPIIIEQNGLGEELFRDSQILQIEVDAGDHKWVSIDGGGVYYVSANGQQTIKHFTKENSPLPTNSITDIKIDKKTGKVYFVSYDGIVTYQGDVADVTSGFGNVLVYPNPVVYTNFKGKVTIKGLAEVTNIRIADAAGNVVHSAVARGGYYEWDLNNQRGSRVASGVYFVLMTNEDGSDKATAKIAVVN